MIADIETLIAVVAAISGTEPIVLIAAPARAKTMPLRALALALNSSSFIVLPSAALAPGDLIAGGAERHRHARPMVLRKFRYRQAIRCCTWRPIRSNSFRAAGRRRSPYRTVAIAAKRCGGAEVPDGSDVREARPARGGVVDGNRMVTIMDRAKILAESRSTLARVAHVRVEHRDHDDDGYLTEWSRGMPTERPVKMVEVKEASIAAAGSRSSPNGGMPPVWKRQRRIALGQTRKMFAADS